MTTALLPSGLDDVPSLETWMRDCGEIELALERRRLRLDFYEFVKAAWHVLEPDKEFVPNWHIEALCRECENIYNNKTEDRTVFNIPPGTLKSIVITVLFPAWVWTKAPNRRFLCASYGMHLSIRDNVRCRTVIESHWYQQLFSVKVQTEYCTPSDGGSGKLGLQDDQNAKVKYGTGTGGWRIATSVGGPGTGEHPDFIIIDDPLTAEQAESDTEREGANGWFDRTVSSRGIARNVKVLLVMQRLHHKDLSAHLLAKGNVSHVRFPMRYEPFKTATATEPASVPDHRDPRRTPGELLFPALFTEDKVKKLEKDLGAYGTAGQLQQRPSPEGGGKFKRAWFSIVDVLPAHIIRRTRGWDTAATEDGGDYTVGTRMEEYSEIHPSLLKKQGLEPGGKFIITDVTRDQLSPAGVDKLMLATAQLDGKKCAQREEKEGGASGKAVIEARAKLLKGYDYQGVVLGTSKIIRSKPFRSQCEAGNVCLLRGPWNEAFLQELSEFPTGENDDQVDSSSCSFNALLLEPIEEPQSAVW
jgi:predicted phage terminase large subunit-like protein